MNLTLGKVLKLIYLYFVYLFQFHLRCLYHVRYELLSDHSNHTLDAVDGPLEAEPQTQALTESGFKLSYVPIFMPLNSTLLQRLDNLPPELLYKVTDHLSERDIRRTLISARENDVTFAKGNLKGVFERKIKHVSRILLAFSQSSAFHIVLDHKKIKEYLANNPDLRSRPVLPLLSERKPDLAFKILEDLRDERLMYATFEDFLSDAKVAATEAEMPYPVPGIEIVIDPMIKDFNAGHFDMNSSTLYGYRYGRNRGVSSLKWNATNETFAETPKRFLLNGNSYGDNLKDSSILILPSGKSFITVDIGGQVAKYDVESGIGKVILESAYLRVFLEKETSHVVPYDGIFYNTSNNKIELFHRRKHIRFDEEGNNVELVNEEYFKSTGFYVDSAHQLRFECAGRHEVRIINMKTGQITVIPVLETIQNAMFNKFSNACNRIVADIAEGKIIWTASNAWRPFIVVMDMYDLQDQYLIPISNLRDRCIDYITMLSPGWQYEQEAK